MPLSLRCFLALCVALLLLAGCCSPGWCDDNNSQLGTFEKDATTPPAPPPPSPPPDQSDHHQPKPDKNTPGDNDNSDAGCDYSAACAPVFNIAMAYIGTAGAVSWYRMTNPARCKEARVTMRKQGETAIPLLRVESEYRVVSRNIQAVDLRVEAGYGPLAAQYNTSRYTEQNPGDVLNIAECYGLYRMSFSDVLEVDAGVGSMVLDGHTHVVESSYTLPILYHPRKSHLGFEFRPAWTNLVGDYDLAALYTARNFSLKAGYRAVISSHDSLSGPYVGLVCRL